MKEKWIIGINLRDRLHDTEKVQHILTKYGCIIKTRLGLHDTEEPGSEGLGFILLELTGDPLDFLKLENELLQIGHLDVKKMIFKEKG